MERGELLRKKISAAERLARRPGPKPTNRSKAICQLEQSLNPKFRGELNRELRDSPSPRRGAPPGNQNRLIHGKYTRKRRGFMAEVRQHVRHGNWLVRQALKLLPVTQSGRRTSYPHVHIVERIVQ